MIAVRPQAMLEAKDLPRCDLSNHLEARVDAALRQDADMRAARDGVPVEQVGFPTSGTSDHFVIVSGDRCAVCFQCSFIHRMQMTG